MMAIKAAVKEQAEILKNGAQFQAVKLHVRKNKKFYMGFGTGALVVLVTRRSPINVVNTVNIGGVLPK
jgi:hypothetical protein